MRFRILLIISCIITNTAIHAQLPPGDRFFRDFGVDTDKPGNESQYFIVMLKPGFEVSSLMTDSLQVIRRLSLRHYIIRSVKMPGEGFQFVYRANNAWKLSPELFERKVKNQLFPVGSRFFSVVITNIDSFKTRLLKRRNQDITIHDLPVDRIISVQVNTDDAFETLLGMEEVLHVAGSNRIPLEEQALGTTNLAVNHVNYVHSQFPLLNGSSVTLSVKENKPDTADIDFKGRYYSTPLSSRVTSNHATIMATIATGAGNSFYTGKGVAWGARIHSADFSTLMPNHDSDYIKYGITIQNHSYGTGIENYYGHDAL